MVKPISDNCGFHREDCQDDEIESDKGEIVNPNVTSHSLTFSPEILRLLTDLLYPDPRMAIREILANAADAITMALPVYPPGLQPQIVVTPNRMSSTLIVDDNGIGLKFDEINVLNMVGADEDKRHRFEEILKKKGGRDGRESNGVKEQIVDLIGRYAIGRLACLCIADRVDIQSKSLVEDRSPAVQWTMRENQMNTEVQQIDRVRPGTRVMLHIKPEFKDQILLSERLEEIVREYAAFLPYPVHIGAETSAQINLADPVIYQGQPGMNLNPIPYRISSDRRAAGTDTLDERYQSLWDSLYGGLRVDPPLTILPVVTDHVRGMLFIPSDPAFLEIGRVRLWCRRMFVKNNEEDLVGREAAREALATGRGLRGALAAWRRAAAPLRGLRFHDLRHQAITEMAEAGATDATMMALAGHMSRAMLEHYSHVRMAAKRTALDKLESGLMGERRSDRQPGAAKAN